MSPRETAHNEARAAQRELDRLLALGGDRAAMMARELERLTLRHHEARVRLQAAGYLTNPDRTARR